MDSTKFNPQLSDYDIIKSIVADSDPNIRIYRDDGVIVLDGLIIKRVDTRQLFPIEKLMNICMDKLDTPQPFGDVIDYRWSMISTNTKLLVKNFAICTSNKISCLTAEYFLRFGNKTINDSMLVQICGDKFINIGHGCSFVYPINL